MIEVERLSFSYGKGAPVLRDVSFTLRPGECAAVLGGNGAGKSTLLKCLDRILRPQSGAVRIEGRDVSALRGAARAREIAYVAQNERPGVLTVFDTVLLGRRPYIRWEATEADRALVAALLERLELGALALRPLSQLSGGEAQKVLLARALAQEPRLLLLDEPTSSLDARNQHEVMALVRALARERGLCVLAVLHDVNLALRYCDRFLLLRGGELLASGGADCVTEEALEAVYRLRFTRIEHAGIPLALPLPDVARDE